nr:hypothetical protein [Pantoea agglomerans]
MSDINLNGPANGGGAATSSGIFFQQQFGAHFAAQILSDRRLDTRLKPALFGEYHAEGKNRIIDMETIGGNKRHPIYLVCHDAGQKKGLSDFKAPSNKSKLFTTS